MRICECADGRRFEPEESRVSKDYTYSHTQASWYVTFSFSFDDPSIKVTHGYVDSSCLPSYSHSLPFVKGSSLNIIFYVWLPDKDKQLASSESKTKTDLQKHDEEDLQELLIRAEQLKGSSPTHLPVYFNYFFISFCISRLTLCQFRGLSDSFIESSQRSYTHMSLP